MSNLVEVAEANFDEAVEGCKPLDIRDELTIGAKYWDIDGGWMALWPSGRGAVCFGGDSSWGDWDQGYLLLDDPDPDGASIRYDGAGKLTNRAPCKIGYVNAGHTIPEPHITI